MKCPFLPHFSLRHGLVVAAACTVLASCTTPIKTPDILRTTETGEVQTLSKSKAFEEGFVKAFPDIRLPANYEIDLERSVIFTSPTQTVGKVVLNGTGDVDSVYRFYENSMSEQGWSLVNAFQSATSSLYFAKPGRFVAIIIESTGKNGSRVTMNVGPE